MHEQTRYADCGTCALGASRVAPSSRLWSQPSEDSAPHHVLLFYRTSFLVDLGGGREHVLRPGQAIVSSPGVTYRRRLIDPRGEALDWLWLRADLLGETLGSESPQSMGIPLDGATVLLQRRVHRLAQRGAPGVQVEAAAMELAHALRRRAELGEPNAAPQRARQRVARAIELMAAHPDSPLTLDEISDEMGLSPAYACVVFKQVTGTTLTRFHRDLRLFASLAELESNAPDLTRVALRYGFSSHAHYTARFHDAFGVTPSAARRQLQTA
ncbi:MAG: AraC family transcriptional regulator [Phycisphaerales bacterium]